MASEVDIANLALSHLGDDATVASLDPPEGSSQAEHCAQFYPIARDSLLELHTWNFATRRVQLSALTNNWGQWAYAYATPSDMLRAIAVISPDATDDYMGVTGMATNGVPFPGASPTPQPYVVEVNHDLASVVLTDLEDAALRYTARVTDTTKFSPLFVMALSHHLASMLAGPILKGDAGTAESKRQSAMMQAYLTQAATSDSNQRSVQPAHAVGWMSYR
jgi:hypothetical protein